jgi:hypothetical protein
LKRANLQKGAPQPVGSAAWAVTSRSGVYKDAVDSLVLWTAHKGAPHIGALFIFKGQKTRFRPIFSAIPHGSFFLNFARTLAEAQSTSVLIPPSQALRVSQA